MNSSSPPSRLEDEVVICNMSLPEPQLVVPITSHNDDYQPLQADLLRAAECPICRCTPTGLIYNCQNGHFVCSSCRPRLPVQKCPCCSANFTKMRNYPLENILAARVFVCDFRRSGCKRKKMTMFEYENHLRECQFQKPLNLVKSPNTPFSQENMSPPPSTPQTEFKCARCGSLNSKRKVKCRNCESNLRSPTPMVGRSPLRTLSENEQQQRNL